MIFPEPHGWQRIARGIAEEVIPDLGDDFLSFMEPWVAETGAPPLSDLYDPNPIFATAALVVNAAKAALALHDGDPTLGGPVQGGALLRELTNVLVRSLDEVPRGHRRLLAVRQACGHVPVTRDAVEAQATILCVARAAIVVLTRSVNDSDPV